MRAAELPSVYGRNPSCGKTKSQARALPRGTVPWFISSVPPFLLKTADNPAGVDISVFKGIEAALAADWPAFQGSK